MRCEICNRLLRVKGITLCKACDRKVELTERAEWERRAKAHAEKYKCKVCGVGLPETHRRICVQCVFNHYGKVSDPFEYIHVYNVPSM